MVLAAGPYHSPIHVGFWDRVLLNWKITSWLDWLPSETQGFSCLYSLSVTLVDTCHPVWPLCGCWPSELTASCLGGRHLINWAIVSTSASALSSFHCLLTTNPFHILLLGSLLELSRCCQKPQKLRNPATGICDGPHSYCTEFLVTLNKAAQVSW